MQKRRAAADVFMEQNVMPEPAKPAYVQQEAEEPEPYAADQPYQLAASSGGFAPPPPPAAGAPGMRGMLQRQEPAPSKRPQDGLKTSEELQLEKEPIKVRETGIWFWRRIIIPPNAYVVHTRIGRKEPVTLGLGLSFRYDPRKDAYLVVPAAMQTIGIVANSISKEKQGINILAYVQWQINDFAVAYRRLDFSDSRDPLGIVNAQLREQAEAAIKDKIATMSVEEVLTDKEPIIEELTTRLKAVAEGRVQGDQAVNEGLGIKIVTVQLKEAYVSSQRLWQDLQSPYRYEQAKMARVSYLEMQDLISQKELATRQLSETREAETHVEIARIKQSKETEALELRLAEEARRFVKEQESSRQKLQLQEETTLAERESQQRLKLQAAQAEQELKLAAMRRAQEEATERVRLEAESSARQKAIEVEQALLVLQQEALLAESTLKAELAQLERETARQRQESEFRLLSQQQAAELERAQQETGLAHTRAARLAQLELEEAASTLRLTLAAKELELSRLQQEIRNLVNERDLVNRLVEKLPELAAHMPEIHELKVLQTGDGGPFEALPAFLARVLAIGESLGLRPGAAGGNGHAPELSSPPEAE